MNQKTFEQRFVQAYLKAKEFGQTFVVENLPEKVLFNLKLNASYDKNASDDFKLFPEDSNNQTAIQTKGIEADIAIGHLHRDG